jgi:hypothetical protein
MKYTFFVYQLDCGHALTTEGTLVMGAYVYCPTCLKMVLVVSVEIHQQEIDDIEEMWG